jgi:polyhydroxyalkanoate synthesis regulator phasin
MNPDTFVQALQRSYRVTLGATAVAIESLQNSQRREDTFTKLRNDPNQLIEEFAAKGETTEREARSFVDGVFSQPSTGSSEPTSAPTSPQTVVIQQDLQELTAQLAALRAELERLRA